MPEVPAAPRAVAERPEPLTVTRPPSFSRPPGVVDRMIAIAGLEAGMTVLEPSAGLGAIAAKAAPLVTAVDCIERDNATG